MISEFVMDKKKASDRQTLLFVVLGILELTAESVTKSWHKSTLTSKILSEGMSNNATYYTQRSSECCCFFRRAKVRRDSSLLYFSLLHQGLFQLYPLDNKYLIC